MSNLNINIRKINTNEYKLLDDFLYEAIFIPEGVEAPPREIIKTPELQVYVRDFGTQEGDICFVAEAEGGIVGAVWVRIMDDYGHIEDGVPSFAISLYKEYRGLGIGTAMMKRMLAELKCRGYKKTSLAVQKANYAVRMYKKVGFEIIDENEEEYIMVCELQSCGKPLYILENSKFEFKRATIKDIDELVRTRIIVLRAANKLSDDTDMSKVEEESYAYYKCALESGEHIAYLVYDNGTFIGAGGVSFYQVMPTYHNPTGKKAYIMNMYTSPEYRRQGIAFHTLDLLVKEAKEQGVSQIALEATDMGRPLYSKYGFVKMEDEMELV